MEVKVGTCKPLATGSTDPGQELCDWLREAGQNAMKKQWVFFYTQKRDMRGDQIITIGLLT